MKKKSNSQSAFLNLRVFIGLFIALAGVFLALLGAGAFSSATAQGPSQNPGSQSADGIAYAVPAGEKVYPKRFYGDVRFLPQVPQPQHYRPRFPAPFNYNSLLPEAVTKPEPNIPLAPMPPPIQNFPGITSSDTCGGVPCGFGAPPDTNGDVGLNHYIQAVNQAFAIYSKTGTLLASFTENQLWAGTGTLCETNSFGDPVVIYDPLADRWILTNLAFAFAGPNPVSPFYECIAASAGPNPVTDGWNLYAIRTDTGLAGQPPVNTLNDYPKFGIWTDCLYYSANGFDVTVPPGTYNGGEFASFSKSDMYAGLPLTYALGFAASTSDFFTMLPSNLSAPGAGGVPPAGTPNYYVQQSLTDFNFRVRKFTAGTNCGAGGTLGPVTTVSQTSYTDPSGDIVPQPNTTNTLDSLGIRLMQKNQYRKVGSAESLWVTHTFRSSSSGPTGSQWAQIDVTGGTIVTTPVQQQLYDPADGIYRWMGSIAADKQGNVAVGYSTSNGTSPNFPSIAYSGRLASDPPNMLPQSETQLIAGLGSQTAGCGPFIQCPRWGDYSSMSVDPSDGCTFWYTTEYYTSQANGDNLNWSTRIGSFKFPSCVPTADLSITKTDSPDPVTTGNDLTYTVTVTNNGPDPAQSVTVTDNLPAETTFVSCSSTGGGVCGGSGNNRTVTFASLASGESETITFVATVNCSVADGTVISNTATVSSSTPDPDPNNNSSTATTTASNPPPTITGAAADPSVLWPPNHRMVNVTVSYDVTDNCPLPPGSCTLSVTSNEPVLGHGSGHTSPDWIVLDDHHVLLRAEREGPGNGRIYTITITCVDSGGNTSTDDVTVTVPHDQGR
jgi:uncharacterized repeat protein (TIGR01451 family)